MGVRASSWSAHTDRFSDLAPLDIFGGESGAHRRPCETEWARNILAEINTYVPGMVKFFFKQMSARTPAQGKALIPIELLIQEWPT